MDTAINRGHAAIAGATVYYLHAAPTVTADLKNELTVLQSFLAAWNANEGDNPAEEPEGFRKTPELPSGTKAPPPATKLVVTSSNHKSTHKSSAQQAKHLSVYLFDDEGWNGKDGEDGKDTPRKYGAVVHVFANNEDPSQGYKDYLMFSKKLQKINSAVIKQQLADAEARNFGTLGQGSLA
ncbi:hypothetical protein V5O48_016980 [Marasmius crinis-equi]|uniref:Uncharacterized protein n=1 Tax=Marasmius crinis-equi TaxID=585013 RepID=A0ABR3EQA2_9AGAR